MSTYHYIFITPGKPVEDLVADLSAACGVPLREAESEYIDFSANIGDAAIELELEHDYEEDYGIPFEQYDSLIVIRDFDQDMERQERTAQELFQRLARLGKYRMMLVWDLQKLIRLEPST